MKRLFLKLIAVLLVPALMGDPLAAAAFSGPGSGSFAQKRSAPFFHQQALIAGLSAARFSRPLQKATAMVVLAGAISVSSAHSVAAAQRNPVLPSRPAVVLPAQATIERWQGLSPATATQFLTDLRLSLSRAPDTPAIRAFMDALRHGVRLTNMADTIPGEAHFVRAGGIVESRPSLNVPALRRLLDRANQGDSAAQEHLNSIYRQIGELFQTSAGTVLFQFIDTSIQPSTPVQSRPALQAIQRLARTWGVSLSPSWNGNRVDGQVMLSFTPSAVDGRIDFGLGLTMSAELFKILVMDTAGPVANASLLRNMFTAVLVKEGGGAADMLARTNAYLDMYNASIRLRQGKFGRLIEDPTNATVQRELMADAAVMESLYQFAGRLIYSEWVGYDAMVSYLDGIGMTEAQFDLLARTSALQRSMEGFKRLFQSTRSRTSADRMLNMRYVIFRNEFAFTFPDGSALMLQDLVRRGLLKRSPSGTYSGDLHTLTFLTDPRYTHERDYGPTPVRQGSLWPLAMLFGGWRSFRNREAFKRIEEWVRLRRFPPSFTIEDVPYVGPVAVSDGVLSPYTASTELFIQMILKESARFQGDVLELGTGSGVLAVALARAGASSVVAVDVAPEAVAAARLTVNLQKDPVIESRIRVGLSNLYHNVAGIVGHSHPQFDAIVFHNPIYGRRQWWFQRLARAVNAGAQFSVNRKAIAELPRFLKPGGSAYMMVILDGRHRPEFWSPLDLKDALPAGWTFEPVDRGIEWPNGHGLKHLLVRIYKKEPAPIRAASLILSAA